MYVQNFPVIKKHDSTINWNFPTIRKAGWFHRIASDYKYDQNSKTKSYKKYIFGIIK